MTATTFAALVRGINVGGKNKLPMAGLKSLFSALGHEDVVSYIQSGNIVFRNETGKATEIEGRIERRISDDFGLNVSVLLRSAAELAAISMRNPFLAAQSEHSRLSVVFLRGEPTSESVARLDPSRSPGDEFLVVGREIYMHLPTGSAHTKLTLDYFERTLGLDATARNWNTLLRLVELTQSTPSRAAGRDSEGPIRDEQKA